MYGWRGRLGLILGLHNTVCEMEFKDLVPEGVSVNGVRMSIPPRTLYNAPGVMREIEREVVQLSANLKAAKPDVVVFTHTTASMGSGEFDGKLTRLMEEAAGCKALTSASALVQALNGLEACKIGVADPFPRPELSQILEDFLQQPAVGFEVVNHATARGENPNAIGNFSAGVAYQFARQADHPDAEAIVVAANVWQTLEMVEALEEDLGKPVISSNQAAVWAALRMIGVGTRGIGSLFRV